MTDSNGNSNDVMLTTTDNPFNPFTQFDDWLAYDEAKGYYTCPYLARVCKSSDNISEEDESIAVSLAIEEIININILGIYIKVTKDNFVKRDVKVE